MQAEITIDPEQIKAAIVTLLDRGITPEMRERLVSDAIGSLVKSEFSHSLPPIKEQFRWAAERVARELIELEFRKPERLAQIDSLVKEALDKALGGPFREKLCEKLAEVFGSQLTGGRS